MRKVIYLILAVFCLFYGLSIMALRSGSRFFLVWIAMGAGFLGLFLCACFGVWGSLPAPVKTGFLAVTVLCAAAAAAAEVLVAGGFREKGEPDLDVIVVLGAQVWPDGPSVSLKYRLDTALRYLEENERTVCIVSGGQGSNEPCTEAEEMSRYLTQHGIAPERILMEDRSENTVENIRFSMMLLDLKQSRTGIVTNNFHVYRSVAIARKQGLEQVCGIAAPSSAFYLPNNMFREAFGIVKDILRGNMQVMRFSGR